MYSLEKEPFISTVVVNYNAKKYLTPCLSSVLNCNYSNFELIVVDNGSKDGSQELVEEISRNNGRTKLIKNETNLGLTIARNQGIKIAKGKYVAFIDNDTRVSPDWLEKAIEVFESEPRIGACQCKLILDGTDNIIDCVGEYLGPNGFLIQLAISGKEKDVGQFNRITEILAPKGAGMIIRKDVLDKIHGFDDDYFIYMDETDAAWRIWLQGYRVVLIPDSIVYHKSSVTSLVLPEKVNFLVKFHGTKNYVSTLIKNLEFKNLIKILPIHIAMWLGIAFVFLLKRQFKSSKFILQGILWNFINFKKVIAKRIIVQKKRVVRDKDIFPMIIRKRNFKYFVDKLNRQLAKL